MIKNRINFLFYSLCFIVFVVSGYFLKESFASDPHPVGQPSRLSGEHGSEHGKEGQKGHVEVHEKHGQTEGTAVHGEQGHAGGHGNESWWRFPGWQMVFAAISCLYFGLVLAYLPLLVAKEGSGGHH